MLTRKPQNIFERETHTGIMQDKSAALIDRPASGQGYRPIQEFRLHKDTVRSDSHKTHPENQQAHPDQPHTHPQDKLVPLTTQVPLFLKAQIQRSAREENLSTSAVAAALLARAVQAQIDMQYGSLLRPVIEECVKREINARIDRTNQLAMNAFLAGEQGRVLTIHVLSLLLNEGGDVLPQLVKDSQKQAWANLKYLIGQKEGEEN